MQFSIGQVGNPSLMQPAGGNRRQVAGPCFLKLLVSNLVAGSIIGRNGSVIGDIEKTTGASMKLSPAKIFFPGTTERIVVISGEMEQITDAITNILDKINDVASAQYTEGVTHRLDLTCKIVVPKSAVSGLIGKAGVQIKALQEQTGAKIQISNREQGLNERVVSISAPLENLRQAAIEVAKSIQDDANLKDHMYVMYSPTHLQKAHTTGTPPAGAAGIPTTPLTFPPAGHFVNLSAAAPYPPYSPHFCPPLPPVGGVLAPGAHTAVAGEIEGGLMLEQCEISMEIPDLYVGPVIGKTGIHITDIMRNTSTSIKISPKGDFVPGTQNRRLTVSGPLASVHRAHTRLVHRIKETSQVSSLPHTSGTSHLRHSTALQPHHHPMMSSPITPPHTINMVGLPHTTGGVVLGAAPTYQCSSTLNTTTASSATLMMEGGGSERSSPRYGAIPMAYSSTSAGSNASNSSPQLRGTFTPMGPQQTAPTPTTYVAY